MRAARSIIVPTNYPPQRRNYAQYREIAPSHNLSIDHWFRLPIYTHVQPQRIVSQHAGERPIAIPESFVPAVHEAVIVLVLPGVTEQDELLWIFDWQHFQQYR